jgi:hypothetical protein
MTWNYRIVRRRDGTYGLHEVYYDDNGEPDYMTVDEVRPSAKCRKEAEALPVFVEPKGWAL